MFGLPLYRMIHRNKLIFLLLPLVSCADSHFSKPASSYTISWSPCNRKRKSIQGTLSSFSVGEKTKTTISGRGLPILWFLRWTCSMFCHLSAPPCSGISPLFLVNFSLHPKCKCSNGEFTLVINWDERCISDRCGCRAIEVWMATFHLNIKMFYLYRLHL